MEFQSLEDDDENEPMSPGGNTLEVEHGSGGMKHSESHLSLPPDVRSSRGPLFPTAACLLARAACGVCCVGCSRCRAHAELVFVLALPVSFRRRR